MAKKGIFIVFEGVEGAGKTELVNFAHEHLSQGDVRILKTAEPAKVFSERNPLGWIIRKAIAGEEVSEEYILCLEQSVKNHLFRNGKIEKTPAQKRFIETIFSVISAFREKKRPDEWEFQSLYIADRWFHLHDVVLPALREGIWVIADRFFWSTSAHFRATSGSDRDIIKELQNPVLDGMIPEIDRLFYLRVSPSVAMDRQTKSEKKLDWYEGNVNRVEALCNAYEYVMKRSKPKPIIIQADRPLEEVKKQVLTFLPIP